MSCPLGSSLPVRKKLPKTKLRLDSILQTRPVLYVQNNFTKGRSLSLSCKTVLPVRLPRRTRYKECLLNRTEQLIHKYVETCGKFERLPQVEASWSFSRSDPLGGRPTVNPRQIPSSALAGAPRRYVCDETDESANPGRHASRELSSHAIVAVWKLTSPQQWHDLSLQACFRASPVSSPEQMYRNSDSNYKQEERKCHGLVRKC